MKKVGKVIFNSDDFGYSYGVNYGIIDAYRRGILTSTTLMANMPGFEHAVELKKEFTGLGVGVHLTLTCGQPLLKNMDSLTEVKEFKKLSFYEEGFTIDWDQLYQEWDAQIQKVYRSGITPTHLDSHHHTHTFGKNQEVVIALAKKYDLPVRGNFEMKDQVKHVSYFEPYFDDIGEENVSKRKIKGSIESYLEELIQKIRDEKSTEVMCHMAYIDQQLLNSSSFVYPRINQLEFLIHSNFARKLRQDAQIELVTYKEI